MLILAAAYSYSQNGGFDQIDDNIGFSWLQCVQANQLHYTFTYTTVYYVLILTFTTLKQLH